MSPAERLASVGAPSPPNASVRNAPRDLGMLLEVSVALIVGLVSLYVWLVRALCLAIAYRVTVLHTPSHRAS